MTNISNRPLKVWTVVGPAVYEDGQMISGQQSRQIVAATSAKAAAAALGLTVYELNRSGSVTGNDEEIQVATTRPGTAFWQPLHAWVYPAGCAPQARDMTWKPLSA
jgi:hypothetical protein